VEGTHNVLDYVHHGAQVCFDWGCEWAAGTVEGETLLGWAAGGHAGGTFELSSSLGLGAELAFSVAAIDESEIFFMPAGTAYLEVAL
jgi:hypothetical protein